MGEDCITVNRMQSQDFTKAVALLNSAQQMAMDLSCDYANASLQQKDPGTCEVFKGQEASCKMVGGAVTLVDCCKTPAGSMGLGQYIDLLLATSQLDNAVLAMDSTSAVRGAWETLRTPFSVAGDAWNSFQADFASGVNNLVGSDMLSTLMAAYTAVMIAIMLIQMIWSCEMPEYELAAKKQLKVCKDLGTYCDDKEPITGLCWIRKESYCCYNSPLARILNEQIKPQLGMDFGTPEKPECSGIKVADLDKVDWNQVNLNEWLGLLALTNHLPTDQNAASMLNLDQLTGTGSRLNPAKYGAANGNRQDTLTRTQGRMTGLDTPAVKRQAEQEGWGMGP
jgi:hypothetical protein